MDKLQLIEAIVGCQEHRHAACQPSSGVFAVGEQVFVRTVTNYLTGRVVREQAGFVFLEDAAWIADTGRFHDALSTGEFSEIEPCPGIVRVNLGSIVDVFEWKHPLPKEQK